MKYQGLIWHVLWGTDIHEAENYYRNRGTYKDLPRGLEQLVSFRNQLGRGHSPARAFLQALCSHWVVRT